ncbi:hypothetical protein COX00_03560 [Candidatus Uhrbacteria bacterium CG22_combo_CG10-13_8_21_14_all_47_17]|uniref:DUF3467 domain-containing protein n=1 Tax=Candidatus Uhrbacteria bacterium CG22_combo_CG10-13_8_21_14_all_47_17 TaxID=1975041 RepID=A0A2H0BRX9_9BACT|nr:MAG: hypothetical protein COX00_03560 [Candidatus Uhrbacteria bacterium CG22_combo_CG10-13_8_21_14_all_47_17]
MPNKQIQIHEDPEIGQGRYANMVSVTAQNRDIVVDFYSLVQKGEEYNKGELVSRVFLNHFTAQELVNLLEKVRKGWEDMKYNQVSEEKK